MKKYSIEAFAFLFIAILIYVISHDELTHEIRLTISILMPLFIGVYFQIGKLMERINKLEIILKRNDETASTKEIDNG